MSQVQFPFSFEPFPGVTYTVEEYPWEGAIYGYPFPGNEGGEAGPRQRFPDFLELSGAVTEALAALVMNTGAKVKTLQISSSESAAAQILTQLEARKLAPQDGDPMSLLGSLLAVNPAAVTGGGMEAGGGAVLEWLTFLRTAKLGEVLIRDALLSQVTRTKDGKSMLMRSPGAMKWAFHHNIGEMNHALAVIVSAYFGDMLRVPFDRVLSSIGSIFSGTAEPE